MALRMANFLLALMLLAVFEGAWATNFCVKVVEPFGYGCTEYSVETDDGYILVMHRLSRADSFMANRHTVNAQAPAIDSRDINHQVQDRGASDSASSAGDANPTSRRIPSCNDESTQGTSSISAHPAYPYAPAAVGSRNGNVTQPDDSSSSVGIATEDAQTNSNILSAPTPAPQNSATSEDPLSVNTVSETGLAPESAPNVSAPEPEPIDGDSTPSSYKARPEVGMNHAIKLAFTESC